MKKIILFSIFSGLLIVDCQKSTYHDLDGINVLTGIVMKYDSLAGHFTFSPVDSIIVYLADSTDTTNFLYSTVSNKHAQYSFSGLDPAISYTIYASIDTGQTRFYGKLPYQAGHYRNYQSDTLKLFPSQTSQNGFILRTEDSLGYPIGNCSVYVFSSKVLWLDTKDSAGSILTLKSDIFGRCVKLNMAPGTYFFHAYDSVAATKRTGSDTVNVGATGIASSIIQLQ